MGKELAPNFSGSEPSVKEVVKPQKYFLVVFMGENKLTKTQTTSNVVISSENEYVNNERFCSTIISQGKITKPVIINIIEMTEAQAREFTFTKK